MSCTNVSGELQDIESNYSGKISHVPSQPTSSHSKSSIYAKPRQTLATWYMEICLKNREKFLAIHVLCSIHHRPYQRILHSSIGSTTTMPMSEWRPSTMKFFLPVEIPQILWLDSKDYRYRSFSLTNAPLHHHLCIGRQDSKTQVSSRSDFPSDAMLWIKEVEMVGSVDGLKSARSVAVPNFELLDARIASALI